MVVRANVVDAAFGPGVAAKDAPCREHRSLHCTVLLHRTYSVSRAGWVIRAHVSIERRDHGSIPGQETQDKVPRQERDAAKEVSTVQVPRPHGVGRKRAHVVARSRSRRARHLVTSAASSAKVAVAEAGRARMTTSVPSGTSVIADAQTALSRRRTVLRITAVPTCLLMMNPNLGSRASPVVNIEVTTRAPPHRTPRRTTDL